MTVNRKMFTMLNTANVTSSSIAGGTSSTSVISSYATGSSELLVPGRVTASTRIPQGAMTVPIEPEQLVGKTDVQQISVECNSYGTICLDEKSKTIWSQRFHWIRAVRLSDDSHSYNLQLRLQPSYRIYSGSTPKNNNQPSKLILQAVRPIEAGQELLLWFSEDILAMLQVVYLRPINIQAHKRYVCTKCSALYESPNPLKLHITLACSKHDIGYLWDKLATIMNQQSGQNIFTLQVFDFTLEQPEQISIRNNNNALDLTTTSTNGDKTASLYRPYNSAFKPVLKRKANASTELHEIDAEQHQNYHPPLWNTSIDFVNNEMIQLQQQNAASFNDDAQIESLVSSLGKAKQGHICLYCGKCYSRKYGLKIHIRTHTGYKPLKCKYCDRPFGDPSNLNKHVRLHAEGYTPYKCELCGKILVRRRDLERHLKSRHLVDMHPGVDILPDSSHNSNDNIDEHQNIREEHTSEDNLESDKINSV